LLPLIRWSRVEWRRPEFLALMAIAGLCLLATQGPEELYMIRWPFRWIPYFHIASVLLFLSFVSRAGFAPATSGRIAAALLLFVLSGLSSLQADPSSWRLHLAGIGACLLALAALSAIPEWAQRLRLALLGAVSLLFFVATHAVFPVNTDIPDWGLPAAVEPGLPPNSAPRSYTLYLGGVGNAADPAASTSTGPGMMPRVREVAAINGYTPIGHRVGLRAPLHEHVRRVLPRTGSASFRARAGDECSVRGTCSASIG
jgi:hypothetical protein